MADIFNMNIVEKSSENHYIVFGVAEEEYGVEVLKVQEIIRYIAPTRLPGTPKRVKGVINFRGKIIPVIDMRVALNLPERPYDEFTVVIVMDILSKRIGIIVDQVTDLATFTSGDLQKDLDFESHLSSQFINGLGTLNGKLIILLNMDQVLSESEMEFLDKQLTDFQEQELT